jgi:hypothetical protein
MKRKNVPPGGSAPSGTKTKYTEEKGNDTKTAARAQGREAATGELLVFMGRHFGKIRLDLCLDLRYRAMTEDGRALLRVLLAMPGIVTEGVYRIVWPLVAHCIQWDEARVRVAFAELERADYVVFDPALDVVFVKEALDMHLPKTPTGVLGALGRLRGFAHSSVMPAFVERAALLAGLAGAPAQGAIFAREIRQIVEARHSAVRLGQSSKALLSVLEAPWKRLTNGGAPALSDSEADSEPDREPDSEPDTDTEKRRRSVLEASCKTTEEEFERFIREYPGTGPEERADAERVWIEIRQRGSAAAAILEDLRYQIGTTDFAALPSIPPPASWLREWARVRQR